MTYDSNYYSSHHLFLVAVDCIIFGFHHNEIRLLVHPRGMEPEQGGLSLMGGFVKMTPIPLLNPFIPTHKWILLGICHKSMLPTPEHC